MSAPVASATASMAFVGLFMPSTTLCLPLWTSASCQMGPKHSMFMPSCSMIQSHAAPDMSSWFMRNFSSMEYAFCSSYMRVNSLASGGNAGTPNSSAFWSFEPPNTLAKVQA